MNPKTKDSDLEYFRSREVRSSEEQIVVDGVSGIIYFWKMGNNLGRFEDTRNLKGSDRYKALAKRAINITSRGRDGKTPKQYALLVHEFDPKDKITEMYIREIKKLDPVN